MTKRVGLVLGILLLVLAVLAYSNQGTLLLALVKYKSANEYDIGPPRELAWDQGPANGGDDAASRPPNIILIVADDLGYNDISTFGGGVADGRLQTPHIDQLAAEDDEMLAYIQQLEKQRDTAEAPEASGDAIAREFERYLSRRPDRPGGMGTEP